MHRWERAAPHPADSRRLPCSPGLLPTQSSPPPSRSGPGAPHNSELARLGARTMLHMMIVDNLIHADLHPGNILGEARALRPPPAPARAGERCQG